MATPVAFHSDSSQKTAFVWQSRLIADRAVLLLPALLLLPFALYGEHCERPVTPCGAVVENYGRLPLSFEANRGQSPSEVKFLSRGAGYTVFFTDRAAILSFKKVVAGSPSNADVLELNFVAASATQASGDKPLAGLTNYFLGEDRSQWRTGIPTYGEVRYTGVYAGIDLAYYGSQGQLEYDFLVGPRADTRQVRMQITGARRIRLDANGDLQVIARHGSVVFHSPVAYQMRDGHRERVTAHFALRGRNEIGFELGSYDAGRALVIDPVLAYSTYLGGSNWDQGNAIAVDAAGNSYITGWTYSADFPATSGAFQTTTNQGYSNAFIAKLNPAGTALVYATYLGGSNADMGNGIALDSTGNVFVTGSANSDDFPVTSGAYQAVNRGAKNGTPNAFVTKLNATGSALLYSTYVGGSGIYGEAGTGAGDAATGIAVDSVGYATIVGTANSANFPHAGQSFQKARSGPADAFVSRLSPDGSELVYSTYLGGSNSEAGTAVAVDNAGNAYVTGNTDSTDFPVSAGAFQLVNRGAINGENNAFVTKFDPLGTLVYSTYLGGGDRKSYGDYGNGIAVDSSGSAYVTGITYALNFPVTAGAYQSSNRAAGSRPNNNLVASYAFNAFLTKLNAAGTGLIYSTYLGGSAGDTGNAIAVDADGDAAVTGTTYSKDFPVTADAFQRKNNGRSNGLFIQGIYVDGSNSFVAMLNPQGSDLIYGSYLGGTKFDFGSGVAVDTDGNVFVTGNTGSSDFPVLQGSYQQSNKDAYDTAYVAKVDMHASLANSVTRVTASSNPQAPGVAVVFAVQVSPLTGSSVPTGTIALRIDGGAPAVIPLNSEGLYRFSSNTATMPLAKGLHSISAAYSGDEHYAPSWGLLTEDIELSPAAVTAYIGGGEVFYGSVTQLIVHVTDAQGVGIAGVPVQFSSSNLAFDHATAITAPDGSATAYGRVLGNTIFEFEAEATVSGLAPAAFYLYPLSAPLTITAKSISVPYGQAIPPLTYTISGFVNGDTVADISGKVRESTTAIRGSVPGTYPINLGSGTLMTPHYTLYLVDGTVTITSNGGAKKPLFSPAGGGFSTPIHVTLSCATPGAKIYYTTDGSLPTTASILYTGPIPLAKSETIQAIGVAEGYTESEIGSQNYRFP